MKILSVCIPTYNRVAQLEELVKSLLEVKSDEFEVVVTNNCSTDNTNEMLNSIKDERLVVYTNQNPEPALYNMIVSIFNASGKYALYCNDRDIVYAERLLSFIDFLKNHEYSYLHIPKYHGKPTYELIEFEKGFDSLIYHPYSEHPTGMVFNAELMRKHLVKDTYKDYIESIFTFCFLCRDLLAYEKSAVYDNCLWDQRPSTFKVLSASGTIYKGQLFFDTETTIRCMVAVANQLMGNSEFCLSPEQQKKLILDVFKRHHKNLMLEKEYYANTRECAHYHIKPRYTSYSRMKRVYKRYLEKCDEFLKNTVYYEDLKAEWSSLKKLLMNSLSLDFIKCEKSIFAKVIKRIINPQYRY